MPEQPQKRFSPLLPAIFIILLVVGGLVIGWFLFSDSEPPAPVPPAEPPTMREVQLYFAAPDGAGLAVETRQIEDCPIAEDCIRKTVEELIAGPTGRLAPTFPPRTVVQTVTVEGSTAWVSFSRDLISGHPGGSMSELLTVYSLADTLAVNFSHIRQVRILVDGELTETLKGHVDLGAPIAADFSLIPSQGNPEQTPLGGE